MLTITGLLTLLALIPLFWIVGYVIYRGGSTINLDFFTQLARPLGMAGGGVLFSIEGTAVLTVLACLFAIPPGVLAAFYVARNPNTPLGVALRFGTDVLAGVPSIVMGLFIYALIVVPAEALFRLGWRFGFGNLDAADNRPHHRGNAQTGSAYDARRLRWDWAHRNGKLH